MLCNKAPKILPGFAAESVISDQDLLLLILLRLPIRSLLKFKSVSKRWLSLISNPHFSHRRSSSHPPAPSGIFLPRPCPNFSPEYDFLSLSTNSPRAPFESIDFTERKQGTGTVQILQSCNGLVLCGSTNRNHSRRDYYVCNPTTKQFTTLPELRTGTIFGLNLAFDPSRSSNYKVVCVRDSDSFANNYQIEIYSSRTGPWRPCQGVFAAPISMRFHDGVYWNGAVHWISTWENCLYFDLREERLHELPMPRVPDGWEERRTVYAGNCGGRLRLIEVYDPRGLQFNVYEMEDDRSGWFVKYRIDLHCVSAAFPEVICSEENLELGLFPKFSVLAIIDRSEGDEESYLVVQILGKVVRVNVESGRFERLGLGEQNNGGETGAVYPIIEFGHNDAYLFIESLACV